MCRNSCSYQLSHVIIEHHYDRLSAFDDVTVDDIVINLQKSTFSLDPAPMWHMLYFVDFNLNKKPRFIVKIVVYLRLYRFRNLYQFGSRQIVLYAGNHSVIPRKSTNFPTS